MNPLHVLVQQGPWPLCLFICKMELITLMNPFSRTCEEEDNEAASSMSRYQISLQPQRLGNHRQANCRLSFIHSTKIY